MPNQNSSLTVKQLTSINIIDKLIYFFSIVFLCSLTNSIFVNQLGYYSTLILILIRFYLTKENPFRRTGLEYALLFYITAEILSTLFSVNPAQSFHNLLKRFFLIPIIYTFVISAHNFDRTKKFIIIYLGAALATMVVYLVISYKYFVNSFYQLYESGPSAFQYPITSSELMSFSLIFLFAFLIHEKMSRKLKFAVFIFFVINLIALLATYKRTGWMGAAAGILLVIILSRRWILLIPVAIVLITAAFIEKNISKVAAFDYKHNSLTPIFNFETKGRPYSILPQGSFYYVSDFENGLIKYEGNKIIDKYNFDAPVIKFQKWRDGFYAANLIDTRFVLLKIDNDRKLKKAGEFLTPGFLTDWCISNGFIYAVDSDSGLTIFKNPLDLNDKIRYADETINNNVKVFADSSYLILFSKNKVLSIFSLNNYLPDKLIITKKFSPNSDLIFYSPRYGFSNNSKLFISDNEGLKLYSLDSNKVELRDINKNIRNSFIAAENENKLFIATTKKKLFEIELSLKNKIVVKTDFNLDFVPTSLACNERRLYATQVKRNRMLSVIDPYMPSNSVRIALWRAGLLIFKDHPLFGVGDIDLAGLYKQYKRTFDKEIQGHMHNNYVHLLVTLGMFGFVAVMFLLVKIFIIHIKNYFTLKGTAFAASYALGATGSFLAFLVAGLSEWNFGDHEIITMIWFMLAMSISLSKSPSQGVV